MKQFSDFNIKVEMKAFTGEKIKMARILNKEIEVIAFKIEKSNFHDKGNGKRLTIHFRLKDEMHIVFTSSVQLMEQINKVPNDGFPFMATIIPDGDSFKLT